MSRLFSRPFLLALAALAFLSVPERAAAQSATELLERAETSYRRDELLDAERVFREALAVTTGTERRRCYERLMRIYVRVGRQDQAIRLAGPFEALLTEGHDEPRLRQLALEVAECYLALGHYPKAVAQFERSLTTVQEGGLRSRQKLAALTGLARTFELQKDRKRRRHGLEERRAVRARRSGRLDRRRAGPVAGRVLVADRG